MRKKKRFGGFAFLAVAFLLFAVGIRLVSGERVRDMARAHIASLSENEDLLKFAISSETQIVRNNENGKLLGFLASESPLVVSEKNEPALEKEKVREELVVWEYTPGGQKKENTYPIENITISPTSDKGYVRLGNIWVKNDSSKGIDLKWLSSAKLPFKLTGAGPHVLIVHTHGSEAYFPQDKEEYALTDVERTSDKRYNVIRIGDELETVLKKNGVSVLHDRNIYDSPSYNGSYTRTLDAIGQALKKNPSIKVVIDIHRDAMTAADGTKYRTVANINGKRYAQMMLVMSTGESGLPHPDWAENLKLAVKLQNALSTKYPNIMRPMNLRKERFNMHATKGSMLVEVGTSANSVGEAIESIKHFGEELSTILKTAK